MIGKDSTALLHEAQKDIRVLLIVIEYLQKEPIHWKQAVLETHCDLSRQALQARYMAILGRYNMVHLDEVQQVVRRNGKFTNANPSKRRKATDDTEDEYIPKKSNSELRFSASKHSNTAGLKLPSSSSPLIKKSRDSVSKREINALLAEPAPRMLKQYRSHPLSEMSGNTETHPQSTSICLAEHDSQQGFEMMMKYYEHELE